MTHKRTAILIGGPADGRRVAVHDNHYTLRVHQAPQLRASMMQAAEQVYVSSTRYNYRTFMSVNDVYLMCADNMTERQALARLVGRYPPEVQ